MKRYRQLRQQGGFTIIEVMIVLTIAALIMLIVFLAVPALQRNARNNQRDSDAAKISAAVNECMSNNNGVLYGGGTGTCDSFANITGASGTLDTNSIRTLTAASTWNVNCAATCVAGYAGYDYGSTSKFSVYSNTKCVINVATGGQGNNQFVVLYQKETAGSGTTNKCIGS